MPSHIVIADDHPLFREALKLAVCGTLVDAQVTEADSATALFAALNQHDDVDLLLLDLGLPDAQGFSALLRTRTSHPGLPIVVISGHEEPNIVARTLAHGAAGFVPKSASRRSVDRSAAYRARRSRVGSASSRIGPPTRCLGVRGGYARLKPHSAAVPRARHALRGAAEQADRRSAQRH